MERRAIVIGLSRQTVHCSTHTQNNR